MKLLSLIGRTVLFLASMALIAGVSLFIVGGYLTTYPILRLSPKNQRVQALVGLGAAVMTLVTVYGKAAHGESE
jgi:uncharacterized membrane protein